MRFIDELTCICTIFASFGEVGVHLRYRTVCKLLVEGRTGKTNRLNNFRFRPPHPQERLSFTSLISSRKGVLVILFMWPSSFYNEPKISHEKSDIGQTYRRFEQRSVKGNFVMTRMPMEPLQRLRLLLLLRAGYRKQCLITTPSVSSFSLPLQKVKVIP